MMAHGIPPQAFQMTRLGSDRVGQMLALQEEVCRCLESSDLYFPLTAAEMQEMVDGDSLSFGAQLGAKLIGFFGVVFLQDAPDNVGIDLGLPQQDLSQIAYFKAVNVLPEYRGAGVQKMLTRALFDALGAQAPPGLPGATSKFDIVVNRGYSWLCATVSPRNLASLKSFLDSGFVIAGLKPKYRGHMRCLMIRKPHLETQHVLNKKTVDLHHYDAQKELLRRGWVGVGLQTSRNTPQIQYIQTITK